MRAGAAWPRAPEKILPRFGDGSRLRARLPGPRLDSPDSIAACAKHYVGYGAAEGGRDYNTTEISEHTLRQIYLPPFHAAVKPERQPS